MLGTIIGSYRVVRLIGEGGFGAVYEAVHEQIGRRVAIKTLHPHISQRPEIVARFFNEARSVNKVATSGVVGVYDFGRLESGAAYIIMEFLEGDSLGQRLERSEGKSALDLILRIGRQLASTLAAVHAAGIVHRDLKPDNVILVPEPETPGGLRAKIVDFGIAKLNEDNLEQAATALTSSNATMGTPVYMSPEQCKNTRDVDGKSDVYSLGVMLYEMVAGRPPLTGESFGELVAKHIYEPPPPLRSLAPEAPEHFAQLVDAMLRKPPAERPSMTEVAATLERIGGGLGSGALAAVGPASRGDGAARELAGPTPAIPGRRSWWMMSLGACVVVALGVGVGLKRRRGAAPRPAPAPVLQKGTVPTPQAASPASSVAPVGGTAPARPKTRRIAIFPFEPEGGARAPGWMRRAIPLLIETDLFQDPAVDAEEGFVERMRAADLGPESPMPLALKIAIAQKLHYAFFVTGVFKRERDGYAVTASVYRTEGAERLAEKAARAASLMAATDLLTPFVKQTIGLPIAYVQRAADLPVAEVMTAKEAALQAYTEGQNLSDYRDDEVGATRQFEKAVKADPAFSLAHLSLFNGYRQLKRERDAERALQLATRYATRLSEREQLRLRVDRHEFEHQPDKAHAVMRQWATLYPDDILAHQALFYYHRWRRQYPEAIVEGRRLLELSPEDPEPIRELGALYREQGSYREALELLLEHARRAPRDPNAWNEVAVLYEEMPDPERAREALGRALSLDPTSTTTLMFLCSLEFRLGRDDKGASYCKEAIAVGPTPLARAKSCFRLAWLHEARGQYRAARQMIDRGRAELRPSDSPFNRTYHELGALQGYALMGTPDLARRLLPLLAAQIRPGDEVLRAKYDEVRFELSLATQDIGGAEDAITACSRNPSFRDDDPIGELVSWRRARLLELKGRYDEALTLYQDVDKKLTGAQTAFHLRRMLGRCLRKAGRLIEAEKVLRQALAYWPSHSETRYELAQVYEKLGRKDAARAELDIALKYWANADPDCPLAKEARTFAARLQ